MKPPLRVIPPSFSRQAGDPLASHVAFFTERIEELSRLAAILGLRATTENGTARLIGSMDQLALLATTLASEVHPSAPYLQRYVRPVQEWKLRRRALPVESALVIGIINLTQDSFSGDGVGADVGAAVRRAEALREAGATIIDVGAESARADRPVLDEAEETAIARQAIGALVREGHIVSIDTYKAGVARAALEAGAEIVNDISGLVQGAGAAEAAAEAGAAYVLNYSYSPPKQRPDRPPQYSDVVDDTIAWMFERVAQLRELGLGYEQIAIDPGIAFGKSHDEDIQVLRRIGEMRTLGLPVLLAHSRKNFIGSVCGMAPGERDLETHVVTTLAFAQGIRLFRVHDAAGTMRAARMAAAVVDAAPGAFRPSDTSWPWVAGATASHAADNGPARDAPEGQRW